MIQPLSIAVFIQGFIVLAIITLPIMLLIIVFITIMGASHPDKPGFFVTFAKVITIVYGGAIGLLVGLIGLGKLIEASVGQIPLSSGYLSWWSMLLPALGIVLAANYVLDHGFQIKQGNYRLSFYALLALIAYSTVVYMAGRLAMAWF